MTDQHNDKSKPNPNPDPQQVESTPTWCEFGKWGSHRWGEPLTRPTPQKV